MEGGARVVQKKPKGEKFIIYSFKIPPAMLTDLRKMQKVTHVLVAEQIRLGIALWLKSQRTRAGRKP
jgi:hypothetical protein